MHNKEMKRRKEETDCGDDGIASEMPGTGFARFDDPVVWDRSLCLNCTGESVAQREILSPLLPLQPVRFYLR